MDENVLNSLLSTLTPGKWQLAIERARVIGEYMELSNPSVDDADRAANSLGMARRSFYQELAKFKSAAKGVNLRFLKAPTIPAETAEIIFKVIEEMGPGAKEADVIRAVFRRCFEAGAPLPSTTAIRTRQGLPSSNPCLPQKLRRTGDLVIDTNVIEANVIGEDGKIASAGLCALIHLNSGFILGHKVTVGSPCSGDVRDAFLHALRREGEPAAGRRKLSLLTSPLAPTLDRSQLGALRAAGILLDARQSKWLEAGRALRATLGERVGRLRLYPRRRRYERLKGIAPISIERLASVVELLIEGYNADLQTAKPSSLRSVLPSSADDLAAALCSFPRKAEERLEQRFKAAA